MPPSAMIGSSSIKALRQLLSEIVNKAHFVTNYHAYVEIPTRNEQNYRMVEQWVISKGAILPKIEVDALCPGLK